MKYSHEYVTFWYVWKIRTTNFEILIGTSFSQMSNFRWVKNSHVFVIPVKNSFELFTCVTNTCEFFTRVTDSFECERQTNLSQVWKKAISFTRDTLKYKFGGSNGACMVTNGYKQRSREPKCQIPSYDQNSTRHWGEPYRQVSFDSEAMR